MTTVFTVRERIPVAGVPPGTDIIMPGMPVKALKGEWREEHQVFSWVEDATAEVPQGYVGVIHHPPAGAQNPEPIRMSIRANPNLPTIIDI